MIISAGIIVLILWLIIGLLLAWSAYQTSVIDRLKQSSNIKELRKQKDGDDNPQRRIN